jgi:hypothetical protein
VLYVIRGKTFEHDVYPEVFQNNIKFIDNKLTLFLKYETMVLNKIQITSLSTPTKYSYCCPYEKTIDLCEKYNVEFKIVPLLDHIYNPKHRVTVPILICNNNQATLLGRCFTADTKDKIVSTPFYIKIRGKDYSIICIKRFKFSDECGNWVCPVNELNKVLKVRHFHSQAILTDCTSKYLLHPVREYSDSSKYFTNLIVFEYQNIELFKNHKDIFNIGGDKMSAIDINFDIDLYKFIE